MMLERGPHIAMGKKEHKKTKWCIMGFKSSSSAIEARVLQKNPIIICCSIGSHSLLIDHGVALVSVLRERVTAHYSTFLFSYPHTAFNLSPRDHWGITEYQINKRGNLQCTQMYCVIEKSGESIVGAVLCSVVCTVVLASKSQRTEIT